MPGLVTMLWSNIVGFFIRRINVWILRLVAFEGVSSNSNFSWLINFWKGINPVGEICRFFARWSAFGSPGQTWSYFWTFWRITFRLWAFDLLYLRDISNFFFFGLCIFMCFWLGWAEHDLLRTRSPFCLQIELFWFFYDSWADRRLYLCRPLYFFGFSKVARTFRSMINLRVGFSSFGVQEALVHLFKPVVLVRFVDFCFYNLRPAFGRISWPFHKGHCSHHITSS